MWEIEQTPYVDPGMMKPLRTTDGRRRDPFYTIKTFAYRIGYWILKL